MHGTGERNHHATGSLPPPAGITIAHPWYWWGPLGAPPDPPDLARLIEVGALSPAVAAMLAAATHAGASIAAVAMPGGAGKTTLITALAAALPDSRQPVHLRGRFEEFTAFDDPDRGPRSTSVLVNELSDHLPIYLWGPGLRRLAALRSRGFQLLATAHAEDAAGLARLLSGPGAELSLTVAVGMFDLILRVEPGARVALVELPAHHVEGATRGLAGSADHPAVRTWLRDAAARSPVFSAMNPDALAPWEAWAATPMAPSVSGERPGAMLAMQDAKRARRAASP